MPQSLEVSQSALLRLARYHCLLEELLHSEHTAGITSREIAAQLGVTEESVRGDLSHVDVKGRPGAGYDIEMLRAALATYLGLSDRSPFIVIGSRPMLEALPLVFPAEDFGMRPIAYFSEREQDCGVEVDGIEVRPLGQLAAFHSAEPNVVALVACSPERVEETLEALSAAAINGVLMLTTRIRPAHPKGMNVTYFRIPCALKSLAAGARASGTSAPEASSCCSPS